MKAKIEITYDDGTDEETRMTMFKFNTLGTALSFRCRCTKIWLVVLGDDDQHWVVTPADAAHLERQGYEVVA
ncbi:MAG: hypothetical protein Q7T33_06050 [Dehalococcoidia bacterium]|nr:hypothetical protein [Dehalococcoidia bacterium]